jgi:hypothetical protein
MPRFIITSRVNATYECKVDAPNAEMAVIYFADPEKVQGYGEMIDAEWMEIESVEEE